MHRCWLLLGWLCLAGCGGRPAVAAFDAGRGAGPSDGFPQREGGAAGDAGLPAACAGPGVIGSAVLEADDRVSSQPSVAFDGDRFALVWHAQSPWISSLNGELRFALVDRTGHTPTPGGVVVAEDDGVLEPALAAGDGEYAVVHKTVTTGSMSYVLRRFDAAGKTLAAVPLAKEKVRMSALAVHPSGYVALLDADWSPDFAVVDRNGSVSSPGFLGTEQVMTSLWLAPRAKGYAAALYTTNHNAMLYLLDENLATVAMGGLDARSPSFAVLPDGLAVVYASPPTIEAAFFDGQGALLGRHTVGTIDPVPLAETGQTALVWTGGHLWAAYPGTFAGQVQLQRIDLGGEPIGEPLPVSVCPGVQSGCAVSAAWGKDTLALAGLARSDPSDAMKTGISVTLVGCL